MTTLKDLLHDVQVSSIEAFQEQGEAEVTGVGIQDYKDKLQEILDDAESRIVKELLGVDPKEVV